MSALGGPRANGLFIIRVCLVLVAVGVMGNSTANVLLWLDSRSRVEQINQERARNAERNCLDVNRRHERSLETLERRIRIAPPRERERLLQTRPTTVLLIGTLAPLRDCVAFAREQVKTHP